MCELKGKHFLLISKPKYKEKRNAKKGKEHLRFLRQYQKDGHACNWNHKGKETTQFKKENFARNHRSAFMCSIPITNPLIPT